jgi:hypothetical protein
LLLPHPFGFEVDSWQADETDGGWIQIELTGQPDTIYAVVAWASDGDRRSTPSRFRAALPEATPLLPE